MEQYEPEEEKEETEGPGGLVEDTIEETNNDELEESNSHGDIRGIDWDEETFNVCKEKMLPLKKSLSGEIVYGRLLHGLRIKVLMNYVIFIKKHLLSVKKKMIMMKIIAEKELYLKPNKTRLSSSNAEGDSIICKKR